MLNDRKAWFSPLIIHPGNIFFLVVIFSLDFWIRAPSIFLKIEWLDCWLAYSPAPVDALRY